MYIQIQENNKCSKCNTLNYTERVTRGMETFIRCRNCGHEKLISTLTVNNPSGNISYQALNNNLNDIKKF